jgi:HD-GYP domain-containing protein (c-di-GMP phosphodiesterase class II)
LTKVVSETRHGDVREDGWRAPFLEEASALRALAARDIDLALYSLLFASAHDDCSYSAVHLMTCAVTVDLAGHWLDWSQPQLTSAVCAALSMNIGMADRQDRLAQQAASPSSEQCDQIERHAAVGADRQPGRARDC